jgi:uncharacterized protein YndB with AHSA1/START domain
MPQGKNAVKVGDEAVRAATGKTWPEWFKTLDQDGAARLDHKGIVALVGRNHGVGPWWQQMVTVGFEQERGLRQKHETAQGFSVSASRTLNVDEAAIFEMWNDARQRRRWLPDPLTVRKATPGRSLRVTWGDGRTNVDVMLYPKGKGKAQVSVQHDKLNNAAEAKRMKKYWADALDRLKEILE